MGRDGTSRTGEIIGQEEAVAAEAMPYDTTTKTGKIAASLMTGLLTNRASHHAFVVT